MGKVRKRECGAAGIRARTALVLVALGFCCAVCFADNDTFQVNPDDPYTGKTAGDVRREENERLNESTDKAGTGMPGVDTVVKMLMWVGVVIVFIYAAAYVIRRYVPSARNMFGSGVIKIVGRTYISSKQYLLLVKVGSRVVMVGVTGGAMSALAEISDPDEAKRITDEVAAQSGHSIAGSFKKMLNQADEDYGSGEVEGGSHVRTETELSGLRKELDAVTQKMTLWRQQASV